VAFYDVTVFLMAICLIVGVVLMAALAGRRRRLDALWYALAPGIILSAYINWDLLCGVLSLGAFFAWSRRRPVLAGVLLGVAVSTKFYPLVFIGPLLVLALRTRLWTPFLRLLAGGAGTWLVINVPVMVTAFDGWKRFYVFSDERPADWGSLWYFFEHKQWAIFGNQPFPILGDPDLLDTLGVVSLAVLCLGVAVLGLCAPTRPRLMQLCFLVLASFMLTNKVWSPQYVVWLVPFAVLARPGWRALVWWQLAEIWYFFAIWLFLVDPSGHDPLSIDDGSYYLAVWARALTVVALMALVVRDILRPERDLVRRDGVDDPSGGVFDGAEDRLRIRLGATTRSDSPLHV
jgi:Predicted integral membrane protein